MRDEGVRGRQLRVMNYKLWVMSSSGVSFFVIGFFGLKSLIPHLSAPSTLITHHS